MRSWPRAIPAGRVGYVVDDAPRMEMEAHDYRRGGLADVGDDLLLLEWDIAVSKEDLALFARRARQQSDRVLVAPYPIYGDRYPQLMAPWIWAHRHWGGEPRGRVGAVGAYPVSTGDPTCNLFGLGMVYLPRDVIAGFFAADYANHCGDVEFSQWHYRHVAEQVPICWDIRPVHLNYLVTNVDLEGSDG